MHELSIALSLLDSVAEIAALHPASIVTAVYVRVGPLSGVMPEILAGAFEMAREESDHPGCRLVIEETKVLINCPACHDKRAVKSVQKMACVVCGTPSADVAAGRELEIRAMEIEELETPR